MPDAFISIAGIRLRLRIAGSGPVILLLHGWALDLDMWQPQFTGLADTFRLIAFDRRGFGFSSGQPSLTNDVEDARALLDALAIENANVVGMSQGARAALALGYGHPRLVSRIVLDGSPGIPGALSTEVQEEIPLQHYRALARASGMTAVRRQWLAHPLMQLHNKANAALVRQIVERYPGRDLRSGVPGRNDPAIDLARITQPALVVNGEYDSAARIASGDDLARELPDARRVIVTGAGHLPNLDNAMAYNERLRNFLSCDAARPTAAVG